jgi:hypothetical protein
MALTQARNEWTRNDFFEKNLGPEETANKYKADVGYPCEVSSFALEQPDLLPAYVDMTLQNIKYKNMSQKASNEKLMRNMYDHTMVAQLNKNPTFSKPDDGEKQNRSATVSLELKNPEFILSKKNDLEAERALENPNSIAKPWMTDPGTGRFDYDAPEAELTPTPAMWPDVTDSLCLLNKGWTRKKPVSYWRRRNRSIKRRWHQSPGREHRAANPSDVSAGLLRISAANILHIQLGTSPYGDTALFFVFLS